MREGSHLCELKYDEFDETTAKLIEFRMITPQLELHIIKMTNPIDLNLEIDSDEEEDLMRKNA